MAWSDRDYAREDRPGFGSNPLMWLLAGRIRLGQLFGVTITAHASMLVISVLVLLFGSPFGETPLDRLLFVVTLFGIVLLHEFGHIYGARATGGEGRDIELTPLGGLAMAQPARGWYSHTITIICGPLVNVVICLIAGGIMKATLGVWPLGPFSFGDVEYNPSLFSVGFYAYYVYAMSYFLLLFNLLPVYPLDGGQLLQGLVWWKTNWFKATMVATGVGLIGAVLMALYAIASGQLLMLFIGAMCGMTCYRLRQQLQAAGPHAFGEMEEPDWMRSVNMDPDEPEKVGLTERMRRKRQEKAEERQAETAQRLEQEVDRVLAKISEKGMASLTNEREGDARACTRCKGGWITHRGVFGGLRCKRDRRRLPAMHRSDLCCDLRRERSAHRLPDVRLAARYPLRLGSPGSAEQLGRLRPAPAIVRAARPLGRLAIPRVAAVFQGCKRHRDHRRRADDAAEE